MWYTTEYTRIFDVLIFIPICTYAHKKGYSMPVYTKFGINVTFISQLYVHDFPYTHAYTENGRTKE